MMLAVVGTSVLVFVLLITGSAVVVLGFDGIAPPFIMLDVGSAVLVLVMIET